MNTANFDRLRVLQACNDYIEVRKNYIENEKEKIINKVMNQKRKFLWFNLKPYTREQVLYNLKHDDCFHYWYSFRMLEKGYIGQDEYNNIFSLLQLCKLSTGYKVTVDSVTVRILSRFL